MIRNDFMLWREKRVIISYLSNVLLLTDSILFIEIFKDINGIFLQIIHLLIVVLNDILIISCGQFVPNGQSWRSLSLLFHSIKIVSKKLSLRLNVFYWPHNWKGLHFRVEFVIWCIQKGNQFHIGIIRVWDHWSDFVIYVPCWWLIKLFTTG